EDEHGSEQSMHERAPLCNVFEKATVLQLQRYDAQRSQRPLTWIWRFFFFRARGARADGTTCTASLGRHSTSPHESHRKCGCSDAACGARSSSSSKPHRWSPTRTL